jgi:hypothetical protein
MARRSCAALAILTLLSTGCAQLPDDIELPGWPLSRSRPDAELEELRRDRARLEIRGERLEREIERLRTDLRHAEQALGTRESAVAPPGRTDAVSAHADARTRVDIAADLLPADSATLKEAQRALLESEYHLLAKNYSTSLFYAGRARRGADSLILNADGEPVTLRVTGSHVRLRGEPNTSSDVRGMLQREARVAPEGRDGDWVRVRTESGDVGWVHESLLDQSDDSTMTQSLPDSLAR